LQQNEHSYINYEKLQEDDYNLNYPEADNKNLDTFNSYHPRKFNKPLKNKGDDFSIDIFFNKNSYQPQKSNKLFQNKRQKKIDDKQYKANELLKEFENCMSTIRNKLKSVEGPAKVRQQDLLDYLSSDKIKNSINLLVENHGLSPKDLLTTVNYSSKPANELEKLCIYLNSDEFKSSMQSLKEENPCLRPKDLLTTVNHSSKPTNKLVTIIEYYTSNKEKIKELGIKFKDLLTAVARSSKYADEIVKLVEYGISNKEKIKELGIKFKDLLTAVTHSTKPADEIVKLVEYGISNKEKIKELGITFKDLLTAVISSSRQAEQIKKIVQCLDKNKNAIKSDTMAKKLLTKLTDSNKPGDKLEKLFADMDKDTAKSDCLYRDHEDISEYISNLSGADDYDYLS